MPRLVKLPSGEWVDPARVEAVSISLPDADGMFSVVIELENSSLSGRCSAYRSVAEENAAACAAIINGGPNDIDV